MRVIVAGGAGFLGSHLCRRLVRRGDHVLCIDDLSSGSLANLAPVFRSDLFRFSQGDVAKLHGWNERADVVIHMASPASPLDYAARPMNTLAANSAGTWNLLRLASDVHARFIFVSTSEVYGDPLVHPQPETYWGNVDSIGPRSMYDEGKRFGEALVASARSSWAVAAAIVRLFNVYGPAMRLDDGRVIPAFIGAAMRGEPMPIYGDGRQTRSFIYVDDLIAGLLHVVDDPQLDGLVANIGNPQEVEMRELASAVAIAADVPAVRIELHAGREGDPRQRCPVIDVMRDRYGWSPQIGLDEGLERTVRWFREQ